jgi:hypothetical protein
MGHPSLASHGQHLSSKQQFPLCAQTNSVAAFPWPGHTPLSVIGSPGPRRNPIAGLGNPDGTNSRSELFVTSSPSTSPTHCNPARR